jgi:hypothetical protein
MEKLKKIIKFYIKKSRLKYNYFSSEHPNSKLRGKLFKFLDDKGYRIQLLKDRDILVVDSKDLIRGGKKLYWPADM